ncbi:MAG: hypothetical protein DRP45_02065 [Candidatus Zixiibacteriota bacterium]|nr:MAG: hypothetical protein DRP45_02065 [candidate division Zixibacteria bacterium]
MAKRLQAMGVAKYRNGFQVTLYPEILEEPLHWRKPQVVFVNSMSDLFHPKVPVAFVRRMFDVMARADKHVFQILTKRSKRLARFAQKPDPTASGLVEKLIDGGQCTSSCAAWHQDIGRRGRLPRTVQGLSTSPSGGAPSLYWPENVWMGVTVESNRYLERIDDLRRVDAPVRFLSLEPLLGPIPRLDLDGIDWVIVGGESGPGARPIKEEWVLDIQEQCRKQHAAFFFKQWGGVNKKKSGRLLKGRTWDDSPPLPAPIKAISNDRQVLLGF